VLTGDLPVDAERASRSGGAAVLDALGSPGSRALLPTPALVCDVDLLDHNLDAMAGDASAAGVSLRPHLKTHKSAFVAGRQLTRGAVGFSCASVSEAEVIVDRLRADGWADPLSVLVTSPVVGAGPLTRVGALAGRCDLIVAVDHPDGVDDLGSAVGSADTVQVVCDVDVGLGRTGVVGSAAALAVAGRIGSHPRLSFAGVQGYGGHLQHLAGRDSRLAATVSATTRLTAVVDALEAAGHPVGLRTGGGTGTAGIDLELGVLNELQAGSYVFMDREYREALGDDPEGRFAQSLTISTTVVSANQAHFVTVDAGLKAMATDAGPPSVLGRGDDVLYQFFGDEHGLVTRGVSTTLGRGDRLDLVPPHCDPTVDRYDVLWLVRGDAVVGVAAIDARGCSQ
jgi:D-serine deaminase-like pyridoxal phosphate-dependent protein